jgi:hypothetical protein
VEGNMDKNNQFRWLYCRLLPEKLKTMLLRYAMTYFLNDKWE